MKVLHYYKITHSKSHTQVRLFSVMATNLMEHMILIDVMDLVSMNGKTEEFTRESFIMINDRVVGE